MRFSRLPILLILSIVLLGWYDPVIPTAGASGGEAMSGISVTGECLLKVAQDRGSVIVASSVLAKTPKEASEQAVRAHEGVRAEVKALNLKDYIAETAGYSVNEECTWPDGRKVCTGYRARLATRFETSEIGRVGDIIAIAAERGSEEVSELTTLVSPALMQREREACLERATRNARAKAEQIAAGAGVKLGGVVSITEGGVSGSPEVPVTRSYGVRAMTASLEAASPTVESRPIDVTVMVSALYRIE